MASIRRGIPHLYREAGRDGKRYDLTDEQVRTLLGDDWVVHIDRVTEKTDGQTMMIGWDHDGFWSKNSGSGDDKMRLGVHYVDRAKARGNDVSAAMAFGSFHNAMKKNDRLRSFMCRRYEYVGPFHVRGEAYNRHLSKRDGPTIRFCTVRYDPAKVGPIGTFVIHSSLGDNQGLDVETLKALSRDRDVWIDDDVPSVSYPTVLSLDASHLMDLDPNRLKVELDYMVRTALVSSYPPKWGIWLEGWVVHPSHSRPGAPTFKIVSREFTEERSNGWTR